MARVYNPAHDGKALQNKKKGGPKEAKGGKNGNTASTEGTGEAQTNDEQQADEEGEGA